MSEAMTWLGRARPLNDTPAARGYWCTDISMAALVEQFAPGTSLAKFSKVAGKAVLDLQCEDCGEAYVSTSRADAASTIRWDEEARRRGKPDRFHRCAKCERAYSAQKLRGDMRKSQEKRQRDEELRWMPYREYLGTDEWSKRRRDVIRRADFKCQVCAADGKLHVHHRTYVRRGVERIEDMIALCPDCHEVFHKYGRLAQGGRAA
ncbi:MAG: HNH endonuclease [Mesorhizobium sp.]|uniref:HNH endonuclease n=1 Tax=Mesorhizobium sp. TaxID=1871066 RepID=UPI000FEA5627|nr:HNH endonuclease [Mesorhizobium sp.]RWF44266.1 MAG: HNH endonuclease [Mesorhizobium sp.]